MYHLLAVYEGFDPNIDFSQQSDGLSVLWERNSYFDQRIVEYYENNSQEVLVIFKRTDDCDSEVEMEYGTNEAWNDQIGVDWG